MSSWSVYFKMNSQYCLFSTKYLKPNKKPGSCVLLKTVRRLNQKLASIATIKVYMNLQSYASLNYKPLTRYLLEVIGCRLSVIRQVEVWSRIYRTTEAQFIGLDSLGIILDMPSLSSLKKFKVLPFPHYTQEEFESILNCHISMHSRLQRKILTYCFSNSVTFISFWKVI